MRRKLEIMAIVAPPLLVIVAALTMALDPETFYVPSLSVSKTNYVNEEIVTNGLTLGGVRNTAWPAAGVVGTVSNAVASAGLLAVDATKTNGVAATTAMAQATLGQVYQSTNATLTALSTNTTVGTGGILLNSAITGMVSNNVASAGLLSVDGTKTNGIAATAAHIVATLGYTPANSNSVPAADNWVASGTTNSTLPGIASANQFTSTNGLTVQGGSVSLPAASVANAALANSAITINGTSVPLGGTRTLTLASSDFANQGTTVTVLHGNGASNPSFASVSSSDMAAGAATNNIGYIPANKAGDTVGAWVIPMGLQTASATALSMSAIYSNAAVAFKTLQVSITNTAQSSSAFPIELLSGASAATSEFSVDTSGNIRNAGQVIAGGQVSAGGNLQMSASGVLDCSARARMASGTDGVWTMENHALTGFTALRLGPDSATTPTLVNFRPGDGSGADKSGGPLEIDGGVATGTGTGGAVDIATGLTGEASASTTNALTSRWHAKAKHVALTHTTATTIETLSLAANKILGGAMTVTCYATNSTPHLQSKTSNVTFDAVAVSTTITGTISQVDNTTAADSGTLTCTYTLLDNGNNTFSIQANANSSLSSPTERAKLVVTALNGNNSVTVTDP